MRGRSDRVRTFADKSARAITHVMRSGGRSERVSDIRSDHGRRERVEPDAVAACASVAGSPSRCLRHDGRSAEPAAKEPAAGRSKGACGRDTDGARSWRLQASEPARKEARCIAWFDTGATASTRATTLYSDRQDDRSALPDGRLLAARRSSAAQRQVPNSWRDVDRAENGRG